MTESSLLTTHPTPNHYPATAVPSLASPLPNGSLSDTNLQDEEEYTIKCICIYADDDGNTVYCPKCDTWQHIECYYHGKKVPEEHFCADCFPRDLDAKKATERQRRHREALDGGDRKVKRPSTKAQKKKHKESNSTPADQVNGWHPPDRHDAASAARDGPPAKKPKTSHRTSGSVVSMNGDSRKRATSTAQSYPSPSKSPQDLFRFPAVPTYTTDFLELYERDEGNTHARENEQTIQAANKLSTWRTDPSLVVAGPGQQPTAKSPFVRSNQPLDQSTWPDVSVETIHKTDVEYDGRFPMWRFLRVQSSVKKDAIVGEVRGQVGMLEEYCQQKSCSNRWPELRHPDPFVFFHPHMDIYIDSRKAGTRFRYLRRSCRPNVTLKTFVSDDDETHHCFVASRDIPAGSELTTTWFLDSGMFSIEPRGDDSEQAQNRRLDWVSRVLANFGDCACDGSSCLLAPFDRRYPAKAIEGVPKEKAGRKKKRSEPKLLDDEDPDDRRSTSESSRSGGQSRDITPVNVAALDADPVLGSGLTARELRKIQMAERAFAQREQEKKDPNGQPQPRKKKRTSGGSTLNTPNATTSKQLGHQPNSNPPTPLGQATKLSDPALGSPPPQPLRGSVGRARSTEVAGRADSHASRPVYISVSVQTEPEEPEMPMPAIKRRKFCTPTRRLLRRLLEDRAQFEQQCRGQTSPLSQTTEGGPAATDIEMADADVAINGHRPPVSALWPSGSPINVGSTTYPLPSQAAHTVKALKPPAAPRLQLSTLPPVPTFPLTTTPGSMVSASAATPGFSLTGTAQSPLPMNSASTSYPLTASSTVTPSPARKKLSLGDYMSRRLASTPSTEKGPGQGGLSGGEGDSSSPRASESASSAVRPSEELAREATAPGALSGSAVEDPPIKDEKEPGGIPADVSNLVAQLAQLQEP